MKLDLQYLDEWSLWLDIKILARTVSAVLKGSGAAYVICQEAKQVMLAIGTSVVAESGGDNAGHTINY
jgi:hypothetical protein